MTFFENAIFVMFKTHEIGDTNECTSVEMMKTHFCKSNIIAHALARTRDFLHNYSDHCHTATFREVVIWRCKMLTFEVFVGGTSGVKTIARRV